MQKLDWSPMKQGVTAKQERACLDLQAYIVKVKVIVQTLKVLLRNALGQLEQIEDALEKATEANKPRRVWSDETRRRMLGNRTT